MTLVETFWTSLALLIAASLLAFLPDIIRFPWFSIASRWIRLVAFATAFATGVLWLGAHERPLWALLIAGSLIWVLIETLFTWFMVLAINRSTIPLFPRFEADLIRDAWPTHANALAIKDWLRAKGFTRVATLKTKLDDFLTVRLVVWHDTHGSLRLNTVLIPLPRGKPLISFSFFTQTAKEEWLVTDNHPLPMPLFYPTHWFVERYPTCASLDKLLEKHRERMKAYDVKPRPLNADSVMADINAQQVEIERYNQKKNFLNVHSEVESEGKLTPLGRYRLWKEILFLKYFGMTIDN